MGGWVAAAKTRGPACPSYGMEWGFPPQPLAVDLNQTHSKVHPLTPSSSRLPQEVAENSDMLWVTRPLMVESVGLGAWSCGHCLVPASQAPSTSLDNSFSNPQLKEWLVGPQVLGSSYWLCRWQLVHHSH